MEAKDHLIVALDGMTHVQIMKQCINLSGLVGCFKFNDALVGEDAVSINELITYGSVFADYKFHDIPNTVKNQVVKVAQAGASFVTIHASGGIEMMKAAVRGAHESNNTTKVVAITVLTSLNEGICYSIYGQYTSAKVLQLAQEAALAGVDAIVCSGQELEYLAKYSELNQLLRIVPGIRPVWHQTLSDQKRAVTPAEAIRAGADYIVVGRPITEAADPREAVEKTVAEIQSALDEMNQIKKGK